MPKIASEIKRLLGKKNSEMYKLVSQKRESDWIKFEGARRTASLRTLVRLWRASGMNADEFLNKLEQEYSGTS